jgi:CheY-like chemotaxis protein
MDGGKKKVVAVLSDLMFTARIQEAARRTGLEAVFVSTQRDALAQASRHPALMILDLNYAGGDPLGTIAAVKGNQETKELTLLGFVSHVQTELIQAAREKGCDVVMARSAFSQNLLSILGRYVAAETSAE